MKGLKTYYLESGTNIIKTSIAVAIEGSGKNAMVRYDDGQWNHARDCFFTEEQCRKHHNLLPPAIRKNHEVIAKKLEKMAEQVRDMSI